jgi:Uncharacterised protein family (UPF0203)
MGSGTSKSLGMDTRGQASVSALSSQRPLSGASAETSTAQTQHRTSGMSAVNDSCRKKKTKYDTCVSKFYQNHFVLGKETLSQTEVCGHLFDRYRACVLRGIKREIWDKDPSYPPPKQGSPLAEIAK